MTNKTNIKMTQAREWLLEDSGTDHFLTYDERETLKRQYGEVLKAFEKGQVNLDELFVAAEDRFRAWFFRSAERLPLIHPRFSLYVSMLLKEEDIRIGFPQVVFDRLVTKYRQRKGVKGIIDGSYWAPAR